MNWLTNDFTDANLPLPIEPAITFLWNYLPLPNNHGDPEVISWSWLRLRIKA
jgi:hypothetical protein